MVKYLTILLLILSINARSQSKLDIAILNLKKIYSENVMPPYPKKIYYNKIEKLIDIGLEGFQIPIMADVKYVNNTAYTPPNLLEFSWKLQVPDEDHNGEKGVSIVFKTKDACYQVIDAIVEIRQLENQ